MCAFCKRNIEKRDCPIPPPIERGKLVIQQSPMERKLSPLGTTANIELTQQSLFIHPYPHRRKLDRSSQHGIPKDNIAVQAQITIAVGSRPIVIVGSAPVMTSSVAKLLSYTDKEYGPIPTGNGGFPFFRRQTRILLQQLLGMYKCNLVGQSRCNVRKLGIDETLALLITL